MGQIPPTPPVLKPMVAATGRAYVRAARTEDVSILAAIDGHCFEHPWIEKDYRFFISNRGKRGVSPQIHVAAIGGRIVGLAVLERAKTVCRLLRIGVLPNYRRSGVGLSLVDAASQTALECAQVRRRIIALSSDHAAGSHAFLRRCGFRATNVYALALFVPADTPVGYRGQIYHFVRTLA